MAFLSEYSDAIERGERLYTLLGTLEGDLHLLQNAKFLRDRG